MRVWRHKLGIIGVAVVAALALAIAGCGAGVGSAGKSTDAASNSTAVKGGVATYPMLGAFPNWIWPFAPIADYDIYNVQHFQWLMYRPLYMFGDNGDSTLVNYALSPATAPVYTDGGKTVVINLKGWKWSDGETVDAQDVIFWLNMMKAEKANYAGYSPGLLPDNLVSYRATGPDQVTLQLNQDYSSEWFTYNQLAEITPMPQAWDVTSLTAAPGSGGCAVSVARCAAVYKFLTAQSNDTATYATSRIWGTVDGPWRLSSFSIKKGDTLVPNPAYSGSPKPIITEFQLVPETNDDTQYAAIKAGEIDIAQFPYEALPPRAPGSTLPATDPLGPGYKLYTDYEFGIYYYVPNFNNPTLGPVFRQLYVRQALQSVDDQTGMDATVFHGYAFPGTGGVPATPPGNQWEPAIQMANGGAGPYPFSIATAKSLLTSHGWGEVGGVMTCQRPGTAAADCGAGIAGGQKLAFTIDWATGIEITPQMMKAYQADAAQAGIRISLVGQSFQTILGESAACQPGPKCTWDALYYGSWDFNGPGFEPTGEPLFETGAAANSGSYSNPTEDKLIGETHTSNSIGVFHQYATYTAQQLPFIWMPTQYAVWAVNSKLHNFYDGPLETILPEYWYYTK
jgi:peptide/nickel transport system substrate-binding protein